MFQDCHDDILQHSPTVLDIEIYGASELLWVEESVPNNFVILGIVINPGDEGEAHLVNSTDDTLHGPSAKFACVVSDFLGEHDRGVCIEISLPSLLLVIPLWENKQIASLLAARIIEIDCTSDTDTDVRITADLV